MTIFLLTICFGVGAALSLVLPESGGQVLPDDETWSCYNFCQASARIHGSCGAAVITGDEVAPEDASGACVCEATECVKQADCTWQFTYTVDAGAGKVLCKMPVGPGAGTYVGQTDTVTLAVTACGGHDSARYDVRSGVTAGQECNTGIVHCTQNVEMICGRCEDGSWVCGG